MSEEMKVPVSEMKLAKYETFIEDMDAIIQTKRNAGSSESAVLIMSHIFCVTAKRGRNTALALVYEYGICNEYAKVIMDKSTVAIYASPIPWEDIYPTYDSFGSIKGKIDAAKEFVQLCRKSENRAEGYKFIFWALMILTVDQSDAEEHLSLICDLANMLHITDDEFEDIIQVVDAVCNGSRFGCELKTAIVSDIFDDVLPEYAS